MFLAETLASIKPISKNIKDEGFVVKSPFVVGVAGGTGSGKTTVARKLVGQFKEQPVRLIPQDAYYKDLSGMTLEERAHVNFDHPLAFDNDLLVRHLDELIGGRSIQLPVYNYITHVAVAPSRGRRKHHARARALVGARGYPATGRPLCFEQDVWDAMRNTIGE